MKSHTHTRFWDGVARQYARDPIADVAGYERTLDRVQQLLRPSDSVLEVGCGTGTTALRLARGVQAYKATDSSREMVAIANEKLAGLPIPGLRFAEAPASAIDACSAYDAVLAFNTLHVLPELDAALTAARAALKPGGLFVSKTACIAEMNVGIRRLVIPLMQALGKAPDLLVFDAVDLERAIERHGFTIEAVERHGTKRSDWRVFIVARSVCAFGSGSASAADPNQAAPMLGTKPAVD